MKNMLAFHQIPCNIKVYYVTLNIGTLKYYQISSHAYM